MKTVVWSILAILASIVGLWFVFQRPAYSPHTDTLTFERVLDKDEGRQLNPTDLVSTEGVHLTDVYSPTTKKFTPERQSRYGADRTGQGGIGLAVTFVHKDGGKTDAQYFQLKSWQYFEETTRPTRRKEIKDAESSFAEAITTFVAPVSIKRAFGIALDTTEGVQPLLAKRVRQVIDETRAVQLGADGKNTVTLNLYNITESPYQGGRERPKLTDPEEVKTSIGWLLGERSSLKSSSVLGGLRSVLEEMIVFSETRPVLHIFTDGLENTDTVSVYKKPEFLEKENWSQLDHIANLASLKLAGLDIHIHPLPVMSSQHATLMAKGLVYLADRLTKAGAEVKLEPF